MTEPIQIIVNETTEVVQISVAPTIEQVAIVVDQSTDKYYRHTQAIPALVWTVNHGLNKNPSVTVTDSAGTVMVGQVEYISSNQVVVTFSASFSGYAELN